MRSASELEQLVSQRDGRVGPSALVLVEARGCHVASDRVEGVEDIAEPVSTRRRDEFRPGSIETAETERMDFEGEDAFLQRHVRQICGTPHGAVDAVVAG